MPAVSLACTTTHAGSLSWPWVQQAASRGAVIPPRRAKFLCRLTCCSAVYIHSQSGWATSRVTVYFCGRDR